MQILAKSQVGVYRFFSHFAYEPFIACVKYKNSMQILAKSQVGVYRFFSHFAYEPFKFRNRIFSYIIVYWNVFLETIV